ncbi:MAG: HlyD family type I secretion periplasmic adaptor subunit [Cypionkella sp.]
MNAPDLTLGRSLQLAELKLAPRSNVPDVRKSFRVAHLATGFFLATFILWGFAAPLNSAAVAPGLLEASGGGRRTVQHLEGGIVSKFLVREGQRVKAGQPLAQLDTTQSDARDAAVRTAYYTLLAQDARLTAERLGSARVAYPASMTALRADPEIAAIIAASESVFATRQRALAEQTQIVRQRLQQATAEIASNQSQLEALAGQERSLKGEVASVSGLVKEGLERYSRLQALERQAAAAQGQRSALLGNIARLRATLAENEAQIVYLRGQRATEAAAEQREVQMNIVELREKLRVNSDIKLRQQITAPVSGTVANLRLITPGAVLSSGEPLLDIVPSDMKIMVAARLKANDIDVVHVGLPAEVRLTAYKARIVPMLSATVREVAADATYEQETGSLYYKVKLEISDKELRKLDDVRLISGMPAEVFIDTGSRSLFQYFVQPVIDSFRRAFRES